ncbi:DUF3800 domain-containing protein [Candidatus Electrothrix sp.]|uniref:DUF3800 domain-containing protein n=3 Tax=Candidatus Electrothrix sp. TaxID=2170559 RepID=UPI0040571368
MATCVLYVDESGDIRKHNVPLKNGQTPIFTLTGLALPLEEWRNIDRELLYLKRNFFEAEISKSNKRAESYEVKGNTLCSPRNKSSRRNHIYIIKLCEMVGRYDGKLFCVSVVKDPEKPTPPTSIYTFSLQYMSERFNTFISEHRSFDKGIIIADSTKRFDNDVAKSHMSFIFGAENGKQLQHIYEAPLFADSQLTAGLQIVDNLSSLVFTNHYQYYCSNVEGACSYEHMKQHWDRTKWLEFKSKKKYDGYLKYGFKTLRHDN